MKGRYMARALLGHVGMPNDTTLAYEVIRLRRRIAELQDELEQLRSDRAAVLDIELHHIAEVTEPALA
jgi:uncharacterized small protein (DUF1192 family)